MTNNIEKQQAGRGGAVYASGASGGEYAGEFSAIYIIAAAKFRNLVWANLSSNGDPLHNATEGSADTIPAGTWIYGEISQFSLHSGQVLAYRAISNAGFSADTFTAD